MSLVFVDTSAWLAISDERDSEHLRAREFYRNASRGWRFVTTNYVTTETYTWLRYRSSHRHALDFHRALTAAEKTGLLKVSWISPELHDAGWDLFSRYHDQTLSMTDCTSAVVAREAGVDYIFSFDSDFSILGFEVRPGLS